MHELWTLLNDSLPSSVIGGIVAGMVVGLVLYYWTGNKSDKARLKHIKNLLKNDIELNLDTIHKIGEHLKSNNLASYPIANNPIKMSSIRVASSDAYVQVMETDMAILVSTLLESGNQFNEDYNYVKSNFESVGNRAHLAAITGQFPDLLSIVDAAMTSLNGELKKDNPLPKS